MRAISDAKRKVKGTCLSIWESFSGKILTTTKRKAAALLFATLFLNATLSVVLVNARAEKVGFSGVPAIAKEFMQTLGGYSVETILYDTDSKTKENYSAGDGAAKYLSLVIKKGEEGYEELSAEDQKYAHKYTTLNKSDNADGAVNTAVNLLASNARKHKSAGGKENIRAVRIWDKDGNAFLITYGEVASAADGVINVGKREDLAEQKSDDAAAAKAFVNMKADQDFMDDLSGSVSTDMQEALSTTDDKSKVEEILEGILDWSLEKVTAFIEQGVGDFLTNFSIGSNLFEEVFKGVRAAKPYDAYTVLSVFSVSLSWAGYALLVFIAIFSIIVNMMSPAAHETPFQILGGTAIATILTINAHRFVEIFIDLGKALQDMFFAGERSLANLSGWVDLVNGKVGLSGDGVVNTIMMLIASIIMVKEILSLILEIAIRYGVYKLFFYTAPVFCATSASGISRGIFSTYIKTFITHLFVMIMNLWVVGLAAGLLANTPDAVLFGSTNSGWILYVMFVLMILKIGQKLDDYLGSMGLSVARTSGAMGGAVLGAAVAGRTVLGAARGAARMSKGAVKKSTALGKDVASGRAGERVRAGKSWLSSARDDELKSKRQMDDALYKHMQTAKMKGEEPKPYADNTTLGLAKKHGAQITGNGVISALENASKDTSAFIGHDGQFLKNAALGKDGYRIDGAKSFIDAKSGQGRITVTKGAKSTAYDVNTVGKGTSLGNGFFAAPVKDKGQKA